MADYQITCINLSHQGGRHEHITHVGNPSTWNGNLTVAQVVGYIRSGHTFFVRDRNGNRANVGVVNASPPHIRTHADNVWTDNLLALTFCPLR